ncbi:MAG: hypothetical protein ACRDT0_14560 [Pseudonocardiaceae bacterium]
MTAPADGYTADPELLARTGREIVGLADEVHATASELSGESAALAGANQGFAAQRALTACEQAWEQAVDAIATRVALAGDLLDDNARRYASSEALVAESLALAWDQ